MPLRYLIRLCRTHVQFVVCSVMTLLVALMIRYGSFVGVGLSGLDRSVFISVLGVVATVVTLFCSLSVAWILFVTQQVKSERLQSYDLMKSKLNEVLNWLHSLPPSSDRDVCIDHAYAIDELSLSDMPRRGETDECEAYCDALASGLASVDPERFSFFRATYSHFSYIESLMNRIGLGAVRQVISSVFIQTLAKGVFLVGVSVVSLISSLLWYSECLIPLFVCVLTFIGVGSCLLLVDVWVQLRRNYDDELDFVEKSDE